MSDRSTTRRRLLLGIGTASGMALAGCTSDGGDDTTTDPAMDTTEPSMTTPDGMMTTEPSMTTTPEPASGRVRVAHMSPNAPNVDIYVDGNNVLSDVPFGAVSGYLEVPAGDHAVTITAAGDPDAEVFSGDVPVAADTDYTIAAIGELGDNADQPFEPLILEDDNADVASDTARLQAVHASPDAPAVDITAAGGDVVLFDGVEYGQAGTVEVDAGTYTVQIRGDTDSNDGDVVAEYEVTLEGGSVYTAFAAGYLTPDDEPADEPFDLLLATLQGRGGAPDYAQVRAAHMSPNAPNVDIYVDGNRALSDVPFGAVSRYLRVPAGDRSVTITAAGDPNTEVFSGTVAVAADTNYTISAIGELGDGADQSFEPLITEDDTTDPGDGTARLTAVHASPDAPAVDITAAGGDVVLFDGVEYGQAGTVEVNAGTYTVQIRGDTDSNDGGVVAEYEVTLESGGVYTAFAAGYLTPDDEPADEPFDLLVTTPDGRGAAPGPQMGRVRAAHMSPNAPNVDIYVDGNRALSDVPFGAVSQYLAVPVGERQIEITAAGDPDTVVFSGGVPVAADTDYTVTAIGELGDDADQPFQPLVLEDDNSDPADGKARLQAVHASPDAPAVDITAAGGDVVLFDGVEYGQAGAVDVDAGSYTVQIRGDTGSNDGDVVAEFDVTLEAGEVYTAFAAGYLTPDDEPADTPFDLLVATSAGREPQPETGRVRAAHMSPNAPDVDIYVDGDNVLSDVPFGAVSQYLSVPAGDRQVEITAAGDPDTVVFSGAVPVASDTDYTIAAIGELGEAEGRPFEPLVLEDDNSAIADDKARLRVVHCSPDAPAVNITVPGSDVALFDSLEYGQSDYTKGAAGDYTLEIREDAGISKGDIVAEFDVTFEGGTVYTAFAAGYLSPDDEPADEPFDLLVSQDSP